MLSKGSRVQSLPVPIEEGASVDTASLSRVDSASMATKTDKGGTERASNPKGDAAATAPAMRREFDHARGVDMPGITGRERPEEIISQYFPAFVGRQERTAFELLARAIQDDYAIFLAFSGAMTPAGLHQSSLIPLIERGLVELRHHHRREPVPRRAPDHRPPHSRDRPERGGPCAAPRTDHSHLRPRLLGRNAARDRQALPAPFFAGPSFQRKMTAPPSCTTCSAK